MIRWNPTARMVDGDEVLGTWRHVFTAAGDFAGGVAYQLVDLKIYADGAIDCPGDGLMTYDEFRDKVRAGRVATQFEEGAWASGHALARWTFTNVKSEATADDLLGEVADIIDQLNGRPDSSARCLAALERYLDAPTETMREHLNIAYDQIRGHAVRNVLAGTERGDWPLLVLLTPAGGELYCEPITEADRAEAFAYFRQNRALLKQRAASGAGRADPVIVRDSSHNHGWPVNPGLLVLRTEYPAAVTIGGRHYPTIEHAFWALRTTDPTARANILAEGNATVAARLGAEAPSRENWEAAAMTIIVQLLRAKFQQHPELVEALLSAGEGRVLYQADSMGNARTSGRRDLVGRGLELVRSEQRARRGGLLDLAALLS